MCHCVLGENSRSLVRPGMRRIPLLRSCDLLLACFLVPLQTPRREFLCVRRSRFDGISHTSRCRIKFDTGFCGSFNHWSRSSFAPSRCPYHHGRAQTRFSVFRIMKPCQVDRCFAMETAVRNTETFLAMCLTDDGTVRIRAPIEKLVNYITAIIAATVTFNASSSKWGDAELASVV